MLAPGPVRGALGPANGGAPPPRRCRCLGLLLSRAFSGSLPPQHSERAPLRGMAVHTAIKFIAWAGLRPQKECVGYMVMGVQQGKAHKQPHGRAQELPTALPRRMWHGQKPEKVVKVISQGRAGAGQKPGATQINTSSQRQGARPPRSLLGGSRARRRANSQRARGARERGRNQHRRGRRGVGGCEADGDERRGAAGEAGQRPCQREARRPHLWGII